jgi:hypothetical protein
VIGDVDPDPTDPESLVAFCDGSALLNGQVDYPGPDGRVRLTASAVLGSLRDGRREAGDQEPRPYYMGAMAALYEG